MNTEIKEILPEDVTGSLQERIEAILKKDRIVLFMKGDSEYPRCGFSANSNRILQSLQVPFSTFDIFKDEEIRQGLKEYSNWPTYPQLYVKGKLIGGNDIIMEMLESGDLQDLLEG